MTVAHTGSPLCHAHTSQLLLIDLQLRLAGAMSAESAALAIQNAAVLYTAAQRLAIPTHITRQYPQGLGELVPELQTLLTPGQAVTDKTCFSCCGEAAFTQQLHPLRRQVIIAGMESHVCVLQTALDLQQQGYQVFVAEDAVTSRRHSHHANAMARLRQHGIEVTNTESVLFEWLRDARHAEFKELSKLIK